jgi:hypothetical protein
MKKKYKKTVIRRLFCFPENIYREWEAICKEQDIPMSKVLKEHMIHDLKNYYNGNFKSLGIDE